MKQELIIKAGAGFTGGSLDLVSAWQVNNEILVLLENTSAGAGGDTCIDITIKLEVETTADHELPVKFYIMNSRDNRGFNSHRHTTVWTDEETRFEFLLSEHEFNKLLPGGVPLALRRIEVYDLRKLLRIENKSDEELNVSDPDDNAEAIGARVFEQNPTAKAALDIMAKANILNGHALFNLGIIGNFIEGMQKLSKEDQQKMLRLYQSLANGANGECLLTGYIHDVITDDVFGKIDYNLCHLDGYLELVEDLQPLTPKMANLIFLEPAFYLIVHRDVAKFDPTFECERYLYNKIDEPEKAGMLANMFCNESYNHKGDGPIYPWMTPQLFRDLVDNINFIWGLIYGFGVLHKHGMLDSHKGQLLENGSAQLAFSTISKHTELTREHIEASLTNTNFPKVLTLFDSLDYTGQWSYGADKQEVGGMLSAILLNQQLTDAACVLADAYDKANQALFDRLKSIPTKDHNIFKAGFKQDLKDLITAANVVPQPKSVLRENCPYPRMLNLFSPPPPMTLDDKLDEIKAKYRIEEIRQTAHLK